ncbi:MAG: 30S ribosomal protein S2 [Verrucomicrobiota bacterium]|nr:30S ribosomal protein S2 [Verrucomicrobiota bacterium]
MSTLGVKELLEAGVHFGHQTRRWNPQMKPYIFEARNGIHVINLNQTTTLLEEALQFLSKIVGKGGKVLFVGTKKQAQAATKEAASACGQPYVTERWLGGMMTNLKTIKKSLKRLQEIEKMEEDGTLGDFGKKEQSMLRREAARMHRNLDGIRHMEKYPDAIFIVDLKREHNAVSEARKLNIPIVAIVDTNCDPTQATHPIPGNDDSIRSIRVILAAIQEKLQVSRVEQQAQTADSAEKEKAVEPVVPLSETASAVTPPPVEEKPEPSAAPSVVATPPVEKTPEPVTPSVVVPPPVEEAPEPVTPSVVAPPPAEVAPQPAAPAETPSATDATDPETK